MNIRSVALGLALLAGGCHHHASTAGADMVEAPADMLSAYPAVESPDHPEVLNLTQGAVLTHPSVVAITFVGDDRADQLEDMIGKLGTLPYWGETTAEYGVGALTLRKAIRLADAAPAAVTDADIQAFLRTMLDGTHTDWPAPDGNTVYAIFYPSTTTITSGDSASCQSFGGYHADVGLAGSDVRAPYAVLPRCPGDPRYGEFDYLTIALSHELIEASNDPFPFSDPAYQTVDEAHYVWARLLGGGESADMCAQNRDAGFQPDGFDYWVTRSWSNAAAASGHDPCVPADKATPYFNLTPTEPLDTVPATFFGSPVNAQGLAVPVGTSRTLELELFSDAPMSGPLTVDARDFSSFGSNGGAPALTYTWDKTTGQNGDKLHLTVTATSGLTTHSGTTTLVVTTALSTSAFHQWLAVISTPAAP